MTWFSQPAATNGTVEAGLRVVGAGVGLTHVGWWQKMPASKDWSCPLPRSPYFFYVVERFLDGPTLGAVCQDRPSVQGEIRAEVRGPGATFMFQQDQAHDTAGQVGGGLYQPPTSGRAIFVARSVSRPDEPSPWSADFQAACLTSSRDMCHGSKSRCDLAWGAKLRIT